MPVHRQSAVVGSDPARVWFTEWQTARTLADTMTVIGDEPGVDPRSAPTCAQVAARRTYVDEVRRHYAIVEGTTFLS